MYRRIRCLEKPTKLAKPSDLLDYKFEFNVFAYTEGISDVVRHEDGRIIIVSENKDSYRFAILGIGQLRNAIAGDTGSVSFVQADQQTTRVVGWKSFYRSWVIN